MGQESKSKRSFCDNVNCILFAMFFVVCAIICANGCGCCHKCQPAGETSITTPENTDKAKVVISDSINQNNENDTTRQ